MASEKLISFEKDGRVALVRLANSGARNALSRELLTELKATFLEIEADDRIRSVILTGEGGVFCSGMDLNWLGGEDSPGMIKAHLFIQDVFAYLERFSKPVVAALNGSALGAGLMLALISDYRVALESIRLGLPEIRVGMPLFLAGGKVLQKYLPLGRIKEMLMWGELIDVPTALDWALVNRSVETEEELAWLALEKARHLAEASPVALKIVKRTVNAGYEMSHQAVLAAELDTLGYFWTTEDCKEGIRSFFEKRPPVFKGK